MFKKENDTVFFVSWVIETYKRKHNIPGNEVVKLFNKHDIIEWLIDNYDVLHTVSSNYTIEEIEEIIQNDAQTEN
jgi:hypothetical protein